MIYNHWGVGIGSKSVAMLVYHGFIKLLLDRIVLEVHVENLPAMKIYRNLGFVDVKREDDYIVMELKYLDYINNI